MNNPMLRLFTAVEVPLLLSNGLLAFDQARSAQAAKYTLTVYADEGDRLPDSRAVASQLSGTQPNLGHVFVDLSIGSQHVVLGYYGDTNSASKFGEFFRDAWEAVKPGVGNAPKGQLRVEADLISAGAWDVAKTYPITQEGYSQAHWMIDRWGTDGQKWAFDHNCGTFAEAMARVAGVDIGQLPKRASSPQVTTPELWGQYLRAHGGIVNSKRNAKSVLEGIWDVTFIVTALQRGAFPNVGFTISPDVTFTRVDATHYRHQGDFGNALSCTADRLLVETGPAAYGCSGNGNSVSLKIVTGTLTGSATNDGVQYQLTGERCPNPHCDPSHR